MTQWPFPGDAPLVRARKCAWAYRAALAELKPEVAAELDDRLARQWGERWISGSVTYSPDDMVNANEAGQILGISSGRINYLRAHGRITGVLQDRRRFLYKVSDVYKLSSELRSRNGKTPVTVNASGPGAPTDEAVSSETPPQDEPAHQPSIMCERLHPGENCQRYDKAIRDLAKINKAFGDHH